MLCITLFQIGSSWYFPLLQAVAEMLENMPTLCCILKYAQAVFYIF